MFDEWLDFVLSPVFMLVLAIYAGVMSVRTGKLGNDVDYWGYTAAFTVLYCCAAIVWALK